MANVLKVHDSDNVLVALDDLPAGAAVRNNGTVELRGRSAILELPIEGSQTAPSSVAIQDGQRVVVVAGDGSSATVHAKGERLIIAPEEGVRMADIGPEGRHVVTVDKHAYAASVWELRDGKYLRIARLRGHENAVLSAAFNSAGNRIVTTSKDGSARVWSLQGRNTASFKDHRGEVLSASFSPDGRYVVTTAKDYTAQVWLANGRGKAREFRPRGGDVTAASFDSNGARIVTISWDGVARVWPAEGGKPIELRAHDEKIMAADALAGIGLM